MPQYSLSVLKGKNQRKLRERELRENADSTLARQEMQDTMCANAYKISVLSKF